MGNRPVVVRLLDVGGDKMPADINLPPQSNPDLGIRGARALEFLHEIYLTQIRAILRSSVYGEIRILYPMISDKVDIDSFRVVLEKAKKELVRERTKFRKNIKEGIMIETPAAALLAEDLLKEADFANLGTNDLLQYTLAAERGNIFVEKRYHLLHPSLVKLMEITVKAGKKLGKEVCLCGEISGLEGFYPLFLSLGLESFSVAPVKYEDIKCSLLHQDIPRGSFLKGFYGKKTKEEIDDFLFNGNASNAKD